jgi:anti-anti-sigma factor
VALKVNVFGGRSFSATLMLEGKLNNDTVDLLDKELARIVASPVKVVVFDLSSLDYTSSAGLRAFFQTQKTMTQRGGRTVLFCPTAPVRRVLEIANATDLTTIFATADELDQYLDDVQRQIAEGKAIEDRG